MGGFSPDGLAFCFNEVPCDECPWLVRRLELETGLVDTVAEIPEGTLTLQVSRVDYSGILDDPLAAWLLVDTCLGPYEREIRTLDSWSGALSEPLHLGKAATWSSCEREIVVVERWQDASNWVRGTITKVNLDTGAETLIDDFGADPDWAWALRPVTP